MSSEIEDIRIESIGEDELFRLIEVGEPGGVEFKEAIPRSGLASSVAAFANSDGGWLLLGVDDGGTVVGFDVPGRAQAHDWLRDQLQPALDPLPEFRAVDLPTSEGHVVVVRIPASSNTPHVLRGSGVVYERVSGSKRPVDSRDKLVALCEALRVAEGRAIARLTELPLVREALGARMAGDIANGQTRVADWHVAATPLQVPAGFADTVMSRSAVRAVETSGVAALRRLAESTAQLAAGVEARPRGYVVIGRSNVSRDEMALTVDAGGAAVARWSTRLFRESHHLPGLADDVLRPLLDAALAPIVAGGAAGAIVLHAFVSITPVDDAYGPFLTVWAADQSARVEAPRASPRFLGGRIASPDESERQRQVDAWWRELGRAAGLPLWES